MWVESISPGCGSAGSRYAVGIEFRYQEAQGVVGIDQGFLDERIDLGGLTTAFTFNVGF